MARLIFGKNNQEVFSYPLSTATTNIGRQASCHVVLPDADISREHAAIYRVENKFILKKLGKSPVFLGDQPVETKELKFNDVFSLGAWRVQFLDTNEPRDEMAETIIQQTEALPAELISSISAPTVHFSNYFLTALKLGVLEQRVKINKSVFMLGSSPKCDLEITGDGINPKHLKATLENGQLSLTDLQGQASLKIGMESLRTVTLQPGQSVIFGDYNLQFEEASEAKNVSTPALDKLDHFMGLVGKSQGMKNLYGMIARLAKTDAPVLILGESGTGKEVVAKALHQASKRASCPFEALNCGAISRELIESELFGHEKGSFTGAQNRREGAFEYAQDGTLFLDEIGELSLELQPKLLRVLESRRFKRVGGNEELSTHCRVITATHRNLPDMVKSGTFREDLFFRLFVIPVYIPPLRERQEDIPLLVDHFLTELGGGQKQKRLSEGAMNKIMLHTWPGNVRELKNVIQRAYILSPDREITTKDLSFAEDFQRKEGVLFSPMKLEAMEKELICQSLTRNRWNKVKTAHELGIARSTLFKKMDYYEIDLQPEVS